MTGPASRTAAGDVASPCVSVCTMDAAGALCVGCLRTLDEIAAWSVLDADAKRAVLAALPLRRAANAASRPPCAGREAVAQSAPDAPARGP